MEVWLDVDSWPRAFLYNVTPSVLISDIPAQLKGLKRLEITSPAAGTVYKEEDSLTLGFRADVPPPGLDKRERFFVQTSIVGAPNTTQRFWRDRDFHIGLAQFGTRQSTVAGERC